MSSYPSAEAFVVCEDFRDLPPILPSGTSLSINDIQGLLISDKVVDPVMARDMELIEEFISGGDLR